MKPGIPKVPVESGDKICCVFFFICLQEKFGSIATARVQIDMPAGALTNPASQTWISTTASNYTCHDS